MKLAQALSERADLKERLSVMSERLKTNAKVQEGDTPAEDPAALIEELDLMLERYEYLVRQINLTNTRTLVNGEPLTALLAHRERLTKAINIYQGFLNSASRKIEHYGRSEVRILNTVSVEELRKKLDQLSREFRECDDRIQELNWTTELIES